MGDKLPYYPQQAAERVKAHAAHFVHLVYEALQSGFNDAIPPILCSPFDAELFGHWWFEGPLWLEAVARNLHDYDTGIATHLLRRIPRPLSPRRLHRHARRLLGSRGHQPGLDEPRDLLDLHPHLPRRALHPRGLHRRPLARLRARHAHRAAALPRAPAARILRLAVPHHHRRRPRLRRDPLPHPQRPVQRAQSHLAELRVRRRRSTEHRTTRLAEIELRDSIFPDIDPGLWVAGAKSDPPRSRPFQRRAPDRPESSAKGASAGAAMSRTASDEAAKRVAADSTKFDGVPIERSVAHATKKP